MQENNTCAECAPELPTSELDSFRTLNFNGIYGSMTFWTIQISIVSHARARWKDKEHRDKSWEELDPDELEEIFSTVPGGRQSYLRTEKKFAEAI